MAYYYLTRQAGDPGTDDLTTTAKIGIGTTAPAYPIDIVGRSRVRGANTDGGGFWLSDADSATTNKSFVGRGSNSEDLVGFYTASAWQLTVKDSTGNVGIGTTNAAQKLEVVGQGKFNNGTSAPLNLPILTADPGSPSNGDLWIRLVSASSTYYLKVQTSSGVKAVQLT
jgi:hypothetical protein